MGNCWRKWPRQEVQFEEEVFDRRGMEGCHGDGKGGVYPGESGKTATGYAEDRAVARGDDVVGICLFCCSECKTLEACRLGGRDLGGFSLR